MRLRHPDGQAVHLAAFLAHSSPTQASASASASADAELTRLLARLDAYRGDVTCISLSLSPALASALAGSIGMRRRVQLGLAARGLEIVTLKAAIAHNSWRVWWTYLLDLAYILADLLPDDTTHGSISTTVPRLGEDPWDSAARELEDLGSGLTEIAWHTGSFIRVACALQEGTLLGSVDDAVRLLSSVDPTRIGVCLDPAKLTELSETPAQALLKLRRAKLNVVKVRVDGPRALPAGGLPAGGSPVGGSAGGHGHVMGAAQATQALLAAVLGGVHAVCDHYEVAPAALDDVLEEFAILGLSELEDRPLPGLGRSVA